MVCSPAGVSTRSQYRIGWSTNISNNLKPRFSKTLPSLRKSMPRPKSEITNSVLPELTTASRSAKLLNWLALRHCVGTPISSKPWANSRAKWFAIGRRYRQVETELPLIRPYDLSHALEGFSVRQQTHFLCIKCL